VPTITIQSTKKKILFQGIFSTVRECVDCAVRENIDLTGADLRHTNLMNASFDDARLDLANLEGANLIGANISEASLRGACFINATLYGACLSFSDLAGANFDGGSFGGTDITGAHLANCLFSTSSALGLEFRDADLIRDCIFETNDGTRAYFSAPPVPLNGYSQQVAIFETMARIGPYLKSRAEWLAILSSPRQERCSAAPLPGHILSFLSQHGATIAPLLGGARAAAGRRLARRD